MRAMRKLIERLRIGAKGQTAMEYALVIAVVATVIIFAAKAMFGDEDKGVQKQIFGKAIEKVNTGMDK